MRFARLGPIGSEIPVVLHDGGAFDLRPIASDIDGSFFASGGIDAARAAVAAGTLPAVETEGVRVGAAIAQPGKIVCVGLNYSDHAEETGATLPDEPVIFMKDPSTMVGAFDNVLIPRMSVKTDWEVELGVVIGATARYLDSPDDAAAVIAGYAVSHDVSERAFQLERGGTWDKGKSCETFNPFGPELVTADEVSDPQALGLRLWVNGVERQNGTTANMAFGVHYVVWYLSQFMVLRPGDVINTGTPAGVAMGIEGQPYLRAGDVVELEIDGLGRARQEMVQA
ncbi:fumarylacetoacetate hydrolase family protein [Salinibacterium sp. NK8237]|uniref:fumarylacetoacetate hydrolase family protein n=1 Tax=Salinibacterium sp. NK8237 TaxID=2792038 RepID=UPI0018CE5750|nr:fumarylacetoacetate hydrolase family protein [Salinibacterium sp. NK8237]MBH0130715.1 fumarylacetoacetate hydrolase family protein [Salinibacterium sp. NK8237]